jgi:hypothetical protein
MQPRVLRGCLAGRAAASRRQAIPFRRKHGRHGGGPPHEQGGGRVPAPRLPVAAPVGSPVGAALAAVDLGRSLARVEPGARPGRRGGQQDESGGNECDG